MNYPSFYITSIADSEISLQFQSKGTAWSQVSETIISKTEHKHESVIKNEPPICIDILLK